MIEDREAVLPYGRLVFGYAVEMSVARIPKNLEVASKVCTYCSYPKAPSIYMMLTLGLQVYQ